MLSIEEVNNLKRNEFILIFGNIVEHFSECAEHMVLKKPFYSVNHLIQTMEQFLDFLATESKETILKLHPDLAGKLAERNQLTAESSAEQKSAGLDLLLDANKQQLGERNLRYKEKFGFPFVICARDNKFEAIMEGLEQRINNNRDMEVEIAIEEVKKISQYRIRQIVSE